MARPKTRAPRAATPPPRTKPATPAATITWAVLDELVAPVGEHDDLLAVLDRYPSSARFCSGVRISSGERVGCGISGALGAARWRGSSWPRRSPSSAPVGRPGACLRGEQERARRSASRSTIKTIRKPSQMLPSRELRPQASVSSRKIDREHPEHRAGRDAAAPRPSVVAFCVTSALASSISSRTSTVIRSETSVTAVAMFSGCLLSQRARRLEDHGEQESAGEGRADGDLGALGAAPRPAGGSLGARRRRRRRRRRTGGDGATPGLGGRTGAGFTARVGSRAHRTRRLRRRRRVAGSGGVTQSRLGEVTAVGGSAGGAGSDGRRRILVPGARVLVAHSGGSSPNTRIQITAARRCRGDRRERADPRREVPTTEVA